MCYTALAFLLDAEKSDKETDYLPYHIILMTHMTAVFICVVTTVTAYAVIKAVCQLIYIITVVCAAALAGVNCITDTAAACRNGT